MKFYRNDPITDEIINTYNNIANTKISEADLTSTILHLFRQKDLVDALAYSYYGVNNYPLNSKFKINYYDCLFRLGFLFDAQKFIEKIFFEDLNKNIIIFERILDLYYMYGLFDDIIDICLNNINILFKSQRGTDLFLNLLVYMRYSDIYFYFIEKYKDNILFILNDKLMPKLDTHSNISFYKLIELSSLNNQENIKELLDVIWGLYHKGERSLNFFKIIVKHFNGEPQVNVRQLFFLNKAREIFNNKYEFLYELYQNLCFKKFYELAYFDMKKYDIIKIITDLNNNDIIRNRFYYFYIKLSFLVETRMSTLINFDIAKSLNLIKPFTLDLTRLISTLISNKIEINSFIKNEFERLPENYKIQSQFIFDNISNFEEVNFNNNIHLAIVGQMRGGDKALKDIEEEISFNAFNAISFSTWDIQPLFPPRFYSLNRTFGLNLSKYIPKKYYNANFFSKRFPNFINKINSSENVSFNEEPFFKLNIKCSVINESIFSYKYNSENFFVSNKLHQAKMFFHFYNSLSLLNNEHIVLRRRPDIKTNFRFNLKPYFNVLEKESNLVYITYFDHNLGFGDRYLLGTVNGVKKMGLLWKAIENSNKIIYASFFDDFTHYRAAEHLVSSHLIACGVKVRYLHSRNEEFLQPNNLQEISLKKEFNVDYGNLSNEIKFDLNELYIFMNGFLK